MSVEAQYGTGARMIWAILQVVLFAFLLVWEVSAIVSASTEPDRKLRIRYVVIAIVCALILSAKIVGVIP